MAGTPARVTPTRGGKARTSLAQFRERERDRGAVMPDTFRAAVAAEMGQAFSPPYQVPIVVAVNGLLMAGAWFLLPHYRWDHRVPLRRMIVRWLILAAVPYALVPALCLLMTVPAFILLVLTHSANNHVISFVDAEGKPFGLALSGPGHPLSGGMFAAAVALTCGVAVVVWVLGRRADMWLIRRRQPAIAAYLADPTRG